MPIFDSSCSTSIHVKPSGIRPERVVDAREVRVEPAAAFLQEVRQQKAHLEERERKLLREQQFVPVVRRRRRIRMLRDELVRGVQVHAAGLADRAHEHDEQIQAARDLPAPQVSGRRGAPAVRGERGACGRDGFAASIICAARDAGFRFGVFRRELRVLLLAAPLRTPRTSAADPGCVASSYASQFTQRRTNSRL